MFEMLRSFTTLAETLNLSHAVVLLGSTRQTVRRHIQQLEEMRGEALFEVHDRQYVLTDAGDRSVREATQTASDLLSQNNSGFLLNFFYHPFYFNFSLGNVSPNFFSLIILRIKL